MVMKSNYQHVNEHKLNLLCYSPSKPLIPSSHVKILVDADACPKVIKEIICKAAHNRQIRTLFVSNHPIGLPPSPFIFAKVVAKGFDVVDNDIVNRVSEGDLVITGDIPLAFEVIAKQAHALNPRGELYTKETIKQRLTMRDVSEQLRDSGAILKGQAPLCNKHKQAFANHFDKILNG